MVQVRAAGAVVIRTSDDGVEEVLAVHRPRYDDWSLPKGKLDPGETYEDAAVREVLEETGVLVELRRPLHETSYEDRDGRAKVVRWWAASLVEQRRWAPDDEIDDVKWIPVQEARARLTHADDHGLVKAALGEHHRTTVLMVRHAHAGDRGIWSGPDHLRPLSDKGHAQARRLLETLAAWRIDRVLTSPYVRCVQTVQPLADKLGLEPATDDRLAEGAPPQSSASLLLDSGGDVTVWCTHGDVMADLVMRLRDEGIVDETRWQKGSTWVLEVDPTGTVTAARYLEPPR
jgi:8-oxo-dGTP diphosphatase